MRLNKTPAEIDAIPEADQLDLLACFHLEAEQYRKASRNPGKAGHSPTAKVTHYKLI